jgi:hypothetical protein
MKHYCYLPIVMLLLSITPIATATTVCAPPDTTRLYGSRTYSVKKDGVSHLLSIKPATKPFYLDLTYEQSNPQTACKKTLHALITEQQGVCFIEKGKPVYEGYLDWFGDSDTRIKDYLYTYDMTVDGKNFSLSTAPKSPYALFSITDEDTGEEIILCSKVSVTLKRITAKSKKNH